MLSDNERYAFHNDITSVYNSSGMRSFFVANPITLNQDDHDLFIETVDNTFTPRSFSEWQDYNNNLPSGDLIIDDQVAGFMRTPGFQEGVEAAADSIISSGSHYMATAITKVADQSPPGSYEAMREIYAAEVGALYAGLAGAAAASGVLSAIVAPFNPALAIAIRTPAGVTAVSAAVGAIARKLARDNFDHVYESYLQSAQDLDDFIESILPSFDESYDASELFSTLNPDRETQVGWLDEIISICNIAANSSSPLVLDINKSGTIDLISLSSSDVYWDIDQDGYRELTGWVSSEDGLLAIDTNHNGWIDDNGELFGTSSTDGFTILSEFDSNQDGVINEEDAVWSDLLIWQDHNEDGFSEQSEIYTLSQKGIISIDLNATSVSETNSGHTISHTSTYAFNDEVNPPENHIIYDVWFEHSNAYTIYSDDYMLTEYASLTGIHLRGYGVIPDLAIAMSLDNSGIGNLENLIFNISTNSLATLFDQTNNLNQSVLNIMYRWAGVDYIPPTSRGPGIDGRNLEFLEKLTGEKFEQIAIGSNPGGHAANFLKVAFSIAFNHIYANLVAQAGGKELFTGDIYYDISSDSIMGITGIDATALSSLETEASALSTTAEKEIFWGNVIRMVEYTIGTSNLSGGDQTALDTAITNSDASLDLSDILGGLEWQEPIGSTYNGTSGDDILNGGALNDTLNGDDGNDTLYGHDGDDTINGGSGDDHLYGGAGLDYLRGQYGNDNYYYEAGDGWIIIREAGTSAGNDNDRIHFSADFDIGDLTLIRYHNNTGLLIQIDNGTITGQIYIEEQFNYGAAGGHIEWLEFSDSSTYDLDGQNWTTYGTDGADTIRGVRNGWGGLNADTIYGGGGNDTLYAGAANEVDTSTNTLYGEDGHDTLYGDSGNDFLYGGAGNDFINGGVGNDYIDGGAGDDRLYGFNGDDIYVYSGGHDEIRDTTGTDKILLDTVWNGITPQYLKVGYDMLIWFDHQNTITIIDHYGSDPVETLEYEDSTMVDLVALPPLAQGDEGDNSLNGTSLDDTLYGFGGNDDIEGNYGNDTLYGGDGNDTLDGGRDNDYLDGGAGDDTLRDTSGDDTYYYSSGHDFIDDTIGADILIFAPGWDWEDMTFTRYATASSDMVIEINGVNSVTIDDQFHNSRLIETFRFDDVGDVATSTIGVTTYGTESADNILGIAAGGSVNDVIYGYGGDDRIWGGHDGDDILYGGGGNDELEGDDGNDQLHGGSGDDILEGGYGDDFYFYQEGNDELYDLGGNDMLLMAEGIDLSDLTFHHDMDEGGVLQITNIVTGDVIRIHDHYGSRTVETLKFSDGSTVNLGTMDITAHCDDNDNRVFGLSTTTGSVNNTIYVYAGDDEVFAQDGNDTVYGGDGHDMLRGNDGNDVLYGEAGNDALYGDNGNDILYGGEGDDYLSGLQGDDVYVYDGGLDVVFENGGGGHDILHIAGAITVNDISFSTYNYDTTLIINGGTDEIEITNQLHYNSGYHVELIRFDDGFETSLTTYQSWLNGTSGNDVVAGNGSDNTLIGFAGDDTITAGAGNDDAHGGAGEDIINGGDGDDLLYGGADNDILYGEDGLDILHGGAGADTFVFEAASAFNDVDTIRDFSTADGDIIDLADILDTAYDPLTDAINDFVTFTESSGDTFVSVDRDGTGGTYSMEQVARLEGITGLSAPDVLETNGNLIAA